MVTVEREISRDVAIPCSGARMRGVLEIPWPTRGLVIFANGFGSRRFQEKNRIVAKELEAFDFATLTVDLLVGDEEEDPEAIFDTYLLAKRLGSVIKWLKHQPEWAEWQIGVFGAGTAAAAALEIAACMPEMINAVVTRGGRPDLAETWLPLVEAPTELIVGSEDHHILEVNQRAIYKMACACQLVEVPGATHLFPEPGAMEMVATLARAWFVRNMGME